MTYTVVQHSGYVFGRKPEFKQGLEAAWISDKVQIKKVQELGGRLFDSYVEAENYCQDEMYPPHIKTFLTPRAQGRFSTWGIEGLGLYIPLPAEVKS